MQRVDFAEDTTVSFTLPNSVRDGQARPEALMSFGEYVNGLVALAISSAAAALSSTLPEIRASA